MLWFLLREFWRSCRLRYLSAPCIENTLLFGGDSKSPKAFCYRLKAQFYKLVLTIHYNNSAYSVLTRFAATFSGNFITLFLFNFDLSVSAHPLFVFVLPMEHKPWLKKIIKNKRRTNIFNSYHAFFYNKRLAEISSVSLLSFESAILKFSFNNSLWKLRI